MIGHEKVDEGENASHSAKNRGRPTEPPDRALKHLSAALLDQFDRATRKAALDHTETLMSPKTSMSQCATRTRRGIVNRSNVSFVNYYPRS